MSNGEEYLANVKRKLDAVERAQADAIRRAGVMMADAKTYIRVAPHMLLFPAGFLAATVLAFVMMGDAIREALDPKLR